VIAAPKIVSGGQTGADRAALDWAIAAGVPHGGWCPKGRRAEDGVIPRRYRLRESPSTAYSQRTRWNVRDADATLIVSHGPLAGGSLLTLGEAKRAGKPVLHLDLDAIARPVAAARLRDWLAAVRPRILNVAGPRASHDPRIAAATEALLEEALLDR